MDRPTPETADSREQRAQGLLAKARDAEDRAAKSRDVSVKKSWLVVAAEYRKLAKNC
jgi:hypothetical protein